MGGNLYVSTLTFYPYFFLRIKKTINFATYKTEFIKTT